MGCLKITNESSKTGPETRGMMKKKFELENSQINVDISPRTPVKPTSTFSTYTDVAKPRNKTTAEEIRHIVYNVRIQYQLRQWGFKWD